MALLYRSEIVCFFFSFKLYIWKKSVIEFPPNILIVKLYHLLQRFLPMRLLKKLNWINEVDVFHTVKIKKKKMIIIS